MRDLASRKWIVSQIGARQHYTIPLGFEALGSLEAFYTDIWCRFGSSVVKRLGPKARDLAGRQCQALPNRKVVSFTPSMVFNKIAREKRPSSVAEVYDRHLHIGRQFALSVNKHLFRHLRPGHHAFFAFNTGCLETLRALTDCGIPRVVDQIDPARVEERIVAEERHRWPNWAPAAGKIPDSYFERLEAEWENADVVLVNSTWCRDALVEQGVSKQKIAVAPIAYTQGITQRQRNPLSSSHAAAPRNGRHTLRVLWLGRVNLRKGIQYLIQAAQLLDRTNVTYRIVGPVGITKEGLSAAPENMYFEGRCSRLDATKAYRWADVFVLPTLSDGFAVTQLEAMAHGLPVVTTPNCGNVVTDGVDGFIVPIRDSESLADAIVRLAEDRELRERMSRSAVVKAVQFGMLPVARRRLHAISSVLGCEDDV